jgi:hypothetical protein
MFTPIFASIIKIFSVVLAEAAVLLNYVLS